MSATFTNWSKLRSCAPAFFHEPRTVDDVRAVLAAVRGSGGRLRVVGSGLSPNDIVCTGEHLLSLHRMDRVLAVDERARTVRVEAGATLAMLNEFLAERGMAFPSLGSVSGQTVAGAMGTGMHGSSLFHGPFSASVHAFDLLDAAGTLVHCSRADEPHVFHAGLCHLGALGVLVAVTLRCEPAFRLRSFEEPVSLPALLASMPARALASQAEFVRIWWFPHTDHCLYWRADRIPPLRQPAAPVVAGGVGTSSASSSSPSSWSSSSSSSLSSSSLSPSLPNTAAGALIPSTAPPSPLAALLGRLAGFHFLQLALYVARFVPALIPLLNRFFRWMLFRKSKVVVDRSDKQFNFDCRFHQYVNEWAVPVENTVVAVNELRALIARSGFNVHWPIEIRFTAKDDAYLSPSYGRDVTWIGIIMYKPYDTAVPYRRFFAEYNALMLRLGGRTHWAKLFDGVTFETFSRLYPRWNDFQAVRRRMDPAGMFTNEYTARTLGPIVGAGKL